jgi:uncharacterized protein
MKTSAKVSGLNRDGEGAQKAELLRRNFPKVLKKVRKDFERGDPVAAYYLGNWTDFGALPEIAANKRQAVRYYRIAARAGVSTACFCYAYCLEVGEGVKKNEKLAFKYYLRAAIMGDKGAMESVARCYYHGIGVVTDRSTANIWIRFASDQEPILVPKNE